MNDGPKDGDTRYCAGLPFVGAGALTLDERARVTSFLAPLRKRSAYYVWAVRLTIAWALLGAGVVVLAWRRPPLFEPLATTEDLSWMVFGGTWGLLAAAGWLGEILWGFSRVARWVAATPLALVALVALLGAPEFGAVLGFGVMFAPAMTIMRRMQASVVRRFARAAKCALDEGEAHRFEARLPVAQTSASPEPDASSAQVSWNEYTLRTLGRTGLVLEGMGHAFDGLVVETVSDHARADQGYAAPIPDVGPSGVDGYSLRKRRLRDYELAELAGLSRTMGWTVLRRFAFGSLFLCLPVRFVFEWVSGDPFFWATLPTAAILILIFMRRPIAEWWWLGRDVNFGVVVVMEPEQTGHEDGRVEVLACSQLEWRLGASIAPWRQLRDGPSKERLFEVLVRGGWSRAAAEGVREASRLPDPDSEAQVV